MNGLLQAALLLCDNTSESVEERNEKIDHFTEAVKQLGAIAKGRPLHDESGDEIIMETVQ